MHIVVDEWLGKGKPAPTLLASYFTLKLLPKYDESLLALTNNVSGYCQLRAKAYFLLKFKTWICPNCTAANLYVTKTKIKVANNYSVKAHLTMEIEITVTLSEFYH